MAVPDTPICSLPAPLEIVTVPAGFPEACGENATTTVALWPGAREMGRAGELTLKLVLEVDVLLIAMLVVELFVTVSDKVALPPSTTVPKLNVAFPRVRFC
jgi:hypothetical protein